MVGVVLRLDSPLVRCVTGWIRDVIGAAFHFWAVSVGS